MQDFWITMYLANMVAIIKNEADQEITEERKDKENKYEYQANVNTLIGSMRDRLADAVFSRNPAHRQKSLKESWLKSRILLSRFVLMTVIPIDMKTPESLHIITIKGIIFDAVKLWIVNYQILKLVPF